MQRIRLSRQLGCGLTGCLYVLDEPTIGLHPHDNHLLNQALIHLKDLGNTLLLVEHDPMTLQIADHIIDFGPGAGKKGGRILSQGSLQEISQDPKSLTGAYLSGRRGITAPKQRRLAQKHLFIKDVSLHNLQHFSVSIPLGVMTCLTGVSGSGKSTLLMDLIRPEVERVLSLAKETNSPSFIEGLEQINKLIVLEQNPIGTTNRADISTYTDLLSSLRALYASLPKAKALGLEARHFSFNHKKGMCKSCWGLGTKTVSLQFLPSVKVPCDSCKGFRLNDLSLQVSYKEKNLGQALQMEAEAAREFFSSIPKAVKILDSLIAVGLGYLSLGQEIATLSGGEAQRLRLSKELAKRSTGKTLYLLDEPSIGLHSCDIEKLLVIFQALVEKGNTVILIEHNLDLIAGSDFLIDLGPKAGSQGGKLVCTGTPEEVACHQACVLAPFLKKALKLP
jgi:excinuclease ABC subunit A